ncbi:hypothetical protein OMO38_05190 [Chryseobacterium sp. 09-1422]|uniref:Uncharacterized protein n=1 Tax=Chryseobacterium kimseyorum TaxID=2984028 RepID=A0ABT3HVV2_9FLAO|nr:hypothetical protein [Chryseobacterium kimseyorum]MCW3167917.1 hypothetical protein [Chryseobacterium kimseyorum]
MGKNNKLARERVRLTNLQVFEEQTLDVQHFSAKVLVKKETHAVVYTRKSS